MPVMFIVVNGKCQEGSLWEMALELLAAGDSVVGSNIVVRNLD